MNKIKMRNFFKISILTCITLASLSTPSTILADSHPGYSYESNIGYQNPSWMSKIEGSTKISEISIPGTHGTMALHGASFLDENLTRNQTMDLSQQLNSGIRYVDMRVKRVKDSFAMYHGFVNQKAVFEDVLKEIIQFLKDHSTETILMRLKEETTPESGSLSFEEIFLKYKNVNASYFWDPNSVPTSDRNNPTLGDTRGKIVILQNFTSTQLYGIDYEGLNIQDKFEIGSGPDEIYTKWIAIKNHLQNTNINFNNGKIYLNHFSGTGGAAAFLNNVYPWFVASGKESRNTDSSPKLIQTNSTNAWSDFPRDRNGQVYYGGMNTLGTELLQQGAIKHSGIIAADFPGPGLIDSIIKLNGIHSNEKEILISQISSESSPLSGQQNRSSQNFKIDSLPVGTKELKWVIVPSEKDYPSTISFNVMIDVSLGIDSTRWKNISHESRTEAYTNTKYYIASPIGATSKFTVKIYAITN
ncbi:phosphatidylinositol-specific phospholipase C [Bacillus thuringiensis]|uniref:phosphatidylinositol-specific phospholipase C n=1 Tax=Bacillus thuringiensis TaxID=1428 RepID=UPI000A3C0FCE|nr:phosphatidylinositol-specific phospholipase C [Bacillus thuringiensis]MED3275521.1 phosphatidylinositol-specific phospholipase C [Bacillus thuringiensis]OTW61177.1 phosphatidylinositol phosphodiesterase [Bacillus thuringiensis serovar silo]OTW69747.1 phosphatidylinositol phosphodiesterase [Bacillus thuringiensis serovar toguchini]